MEESNVRKIPPISEIKVILKEIQSEESKRLQESLRGYLNRAYIHTVFFMQNALSPELKEILFPGLEIRDISKYDFSKANIDVYILNEKDNEIFNKRVGLDTGIAASAFTRKGSEGYSDTERPLLVFGFIPIKKREDISEEENYLLTQMSIISCFNHELLHILGLNTSKIPYAFTEGLVEALAQTITKKDEYFFKYSHLHKYAPLGYGSVANGMGLLINILINNGIPLDTIIKGFGKGDGESLSIVIKKISDIYGQEFALNLPRVAEEHPEKLEEYIKSSKNIT